MDVQARFQGTLLGLAIGDAVGTTVEFSEPGTFAPLTDMTGGGPFNLNAGEWTDDTSMALCLADSLIACNGFDPADQMQRYVRWMTEGYLSSNGRCFDVGNTVREALNRFRRTGTPYAGSTDPFSAGNGSLMRVAPIPLYYMSDAEQTAEYAVKSSCTTHAAPVCLDACHYYALLIHKALNGTDREQLMAPFSCRQYAPEIAAIAQGSYKEKHPPAIRGSGYVVHSLEAALWAFYNSTSFREGVLLAANLGEDADTTAAVYGQLAGAYYGCDGIPPAWMERVAHRRRIQTFADQLYRLASARTNGR